VRAPFPSSRLEVITPDDQTWVCFGIFVGYDGGNVDTVSVEPPPPYGSKVVHVDTRIVNDAIVETVDVICDVGGPL
jgi:hypothetical protein